MEVEPILWLLTKQIMTGIKLFGYSLNAWISTALARLPHICEAPFIWLKYGLDFDDVWAG